MFDYKTLLSTPINELTFSVVDTETTGMHSQFNRVMDVGIVTIKNEKIIDTWETLIDPQQEVSYWITNFTKLTNNHVRGKPLFSSVAPTIKSKITNTVIVGHNVGFDYYFLLHEFKRLGTEFKLPKLCTVLLGRKLLPDLPNYHLDALSDYYDLKISQRHRALPDAYATAEVFLKFIDIARERYNVKSFFDLEKLQKVKIEKKSAAFKDFNPALFPLD